MTSLAETRQVADRARVVPSARVGLRSLPRALWLVLAVYLGVGTVYATVTPLFEKPDEQWHFAFAMYVADTGRLPVQRLEGRDHLAEQEGSQPPLYYAVLAGLMKAPGLDGLDAGYAQLTEANPYYGGRPGAWLENANRFVHGPCEGECRRAATAVYLGRGLSVAAGAAALLFAAIAVHLAFPRQPWLLLLVVGAIAFNPQFLHISSSVSNDAFLMGTANLAFALGLWWWHRPQSAGRAAALGLAVGLAVLSKSSGLSLVATMGLLVLVGGRLPWPLRLRQVGIFTLIVALVSGWWIGRNLVLYGEPTATQIHLRIFDVAPPSFTLSEMVGDWQMVANSLWASFGWGGLNLSDGLYRAARTLALVLAAAFGWAAVRGWRQWTDAQRVFVGLSLLHLLVVGGLLFQWMRMTEAPHGRLLFPALLPITLGLMLGFLSLVPRRFHALASSGYVSAWAMAAVVLALGFVRPAYTPSAMLATLPEGAVPLGIQFGDALVLEGYEAPTEPVAPGAVVPLTLYWRAVEPMDEELAVAVKWFGHEGALLARDDSYPDGGRWPTRAWPTGTLIADRKRVMVSSAAATPTLAEVTVDVYRPATLEQLPASVGGAGVPLPVEVGEIFVRAAGAEPAAPAPYLYRPVVERVTLDGQSVEVAFAWEVGQRLAGDYRALFHLAPSADAPPVAQGDFEPMGGDLPTGAWWPGDRLADGARLTLPEEVAAGEYVVLLGLYDAATGERVAGAETPGVWTVARLRWDGESWRTLD